MNIHESNRFKSFDNNVECLKCMNKEVAASKELTELSDRLFKPENLLEGEMGAWA